MTGDEVRPASRPDPAAADDDELPTGPPLFRAATRGLLECAVRPEVRVDTLRAPQRLAPYSFAIGAEVLDPDEGEIASGRLVLLHDPDGHEAWDGVLRLVAFASAEMDPAMGVDPMLPQVGWSWLTGALDERGAAFRAAGGTVTQTTSTRFGDLAGPSTAVSLELRASWTVAMEDRPDTPGAAGASPDDTELDTGLDTGLGRHLLAFVDLLCAAAGLPPEGVSVLPRG